jgi:hypothetical protein
MAEKLKEKKIIICGIICTTLIIFGTLFWPTLYRYDKTNFGNNRSGQYLTRVNRLTGYTEILYESGWEPKRGEEKAEAMPQHERDKVKITGYFRYKPTEGEQYARYILDENIYKGDIYNGTSWTIKKLRLSIGAKDKDEKIHWQKTYEASIDIAPFSIGSCSIKLMDAITIMEFEPYTGPTQSKEEVASNKGRWEYTYTADELKQIAAGKKLSKKGKWILSDKPPVRLDLIPDIRIEEIFGYKNE